MYPSSPHKNSSNTMEKIRSNSWENLTQYYLLNCRIVVHSMRNLNDMPYTLSVKIPGTCKRNFPSNRSCAIIQTNLKCQSCIHWLKNPRKKHALKSTSVTVYVSIESAQKSKKYRIVGEFNSVLLVELSYRSKHHSMRNRS